jgi:hypothetical protein
MINLIENEWIWSFWLEFRLNRDEFDHFWFEFRLKRMNMGFLAEILIEKEWTWLILAEICEQEVEKTLC